MVNAGRQVLNEVMVNGLHLLENLRIKLDPEHVAKTIDPRSRGPGFENLQPFIDQVLEQSQPRALYAPREIEARGDDFLQVREVRIASRVLARHAVPGLPVFLFVATLGARIEAAIHGGRDVLEQYCLETVANLALDEAVRQLHLHLSREYHLPRLYCLSPGTLSDWPIEEQRKLFALLGRVEEALGVRLTEHLLMIPRMSLSGVFFPSNLDFSECRLCQMRTKCQLSKNAAALPES